MALTVEPFWHRIRYTRLRDVLRGRVDGRLDWRRVVAEAELPIELDETIAQVIKKARLWKSERCAVGVELAAHFKDGLDAGVSSEELLASFGDVDQTAKLIRSAKRRGRPLWWQGWWWASRSAAVLVAFYVLMVGMLAFDKPVVSTDYLTELNQKYVLMPEKERAWPHYMEALEWLKAHAEPLQERADIENPSVDFWLTGPEGSLSDSIYNYTDLEDVEREKVDRWLEEQTAFIELVRKAARYERLGLASGKYSPRYRQLFGISESTAEPGGKEEFVFTVLLAHVQAIQKINAILRADFYRMLDREDGDTALKNLQAMISSIQHLGDGPWIVCGLLKCMRLNRAMECVEQVLATNPELWDDEKLVEIAHLLSTVKLEVNDYVEGEKASFLDIVQRLYSDDGDGDGYLTAAGLKQMDREFQPMLIVDGMPPISFYSNWQYRAAAPASYLFAASRREIIAKNDEFWARMQTEALRPLWDAVPEEETVEQELMQMSQIEKYRYAPLLMMLPAYQSATMAFHKTKGRMEGVLSGIALELYRREHGEWPETLKQLSPGLLPKVPVDRVTGGALGYRIDEGQPVIYSLGVDGDDDGGRLPEDCDGEKMAYILLNAVADNDGDWVIWDLRKP